MSCWTNLIASVITKNSLPLTIIQNVKTFAFYVGHGPSAKNVLRNEILIRTSGNQKILLDTLSTWIDCYFFHVCQVCNVHVKS